MFNIQVEKKAMDEWTGGRIRLVQSPHSRDYEVQEIS